MSEGFVLRPVHEADMEKVFRLSNDPDVRRQSVSTGSIAWEKHVEWFGSMLREAPQDFLIAETPAKEFIGQIRFKNLEEGALISISLCRGFRGRGLGEKLIRKALELSSHRVFQAWVKIQNPASWKMFEKTGFVETGQTCIEGQAYKVYRYEK